jgi:hypothetical protein
MIMYENRGSFFSILWCKIWNIEEIWKIGSTSNFLFIFSIFNYFDKKLLITNKICNSHNLTLQLLL